MAKTYKVKEGDTLGQIARNFGVSTNEITGFKSGNPDLIFPDEVLTIGESESSQPDDSSAYTSAVRDELDDTQEESFNTSDPFGVAKVRDDYETYKANRESAFENLKGLTTETFDSEYDKRELSKKKERISQIDTEIAAARKERDEAIAKVRSNPGLSASQMTGDIKKLADFQNNIINNLISERNGVAKEYNSELAEIDRIIENTVGDARLDYQYWSDLLGEAGDTIEEYTKAYREELASEQDQDNFERQLAQALEIAQMRGDGGSNTKLQLVRDEFSGEPLYWFNPVTGEITYIDEDGGGSTDGGDDFENLDVDEEEGSDEPGYLSRLFNAILGR